MGIYRNKSVETRSQAEHSYAGDRFVKVNEITKRLGTSQLVAETYDSELPCSSTNEVITI